MISRFDYVPQLEVMDTYDKIPFQELYLAGKEKQAQRTITSPFGKDDKLESIAEHAPALNNTAAYIDSQMNSLRDKMLKAKTPEERAGIANEVAKLGQYARADKEIYRRGIEKQKEYEAAVKSTQNYRPWNDEKVMREIRGKVQGIDNIYVKDGRPLDFTFEAPLNGVDETKDFLDYLKNQKDSGYLNDIDDITQDENGNIKYTTVRGGEGVSAERIASLTNEYKKYMINGPVGQEFRRRAEYDLLNAGIANPTQEQLDKVTASYINNVTGNLQHAFVHNKTISKDKKSPIGSDYGKRKQIITNPSDFTMQNAQTIQNPAYSSVDGNKLTVAYDEAGKPISYKTWKDMYNNFDVTTWSKIGQKLSANLDKIKAGATKLDELFGSSVYVGNTKPADQKMLDATIKEALAESGMNIKVTDDVVNATKTALKELANNPALYNTIGQVNPATGLKTSLGDVVRQHIEAKQNSSDYTPRNMAPLAWDAKKATTQLVGNNIDIEKKFKAELPGSKEPVNITKYIQTLYPQDAQNAGLVTNATADNKTKFVSAYATNKPEGAWTYSIGRSNAFKGKMIMDITAPNGQNFEVPIEGADAFYDKTLEPVSKINKRLETGDYSPGQVYEMGQADPGKYYMFELSPDPNTSRMRYEPKIYNKIEDPAQRGQLRNAVVAKYANAFTAAGGKGTLTAGTLGGKNTQIINQILAQNNEYLRITERGDLVDLSRPVQNFDEFAIDRNIKATNAFSNNFLAKETDYQMSSGNDMPQTTEVFSDEENQ